MINPGCSSIPPDHPPKVSSILGDDDAVFLDAPCKRTVVRRATSPDVQWVHGIVSPRVVEPNRKLGRKAFVDKKPHATSDQGFPAGCSIKGCVRA
jgi:hypothetical protein